MRDMDSGIELINITTRISHSSNSHERENASTHYREQSKQVIFSSENSVPNILAGFITWFIYHDEYRDHVITVA